MVFESLVADLLNRYLGEYVENLDKGQLKIGIWGGKTSQCSRSRFSASKIAEKYRFFCVTLNHSFVYEPLTEFIIRSDYKTLDCEVAMS